MPESYLRTDLSIDQHLALGTAATRLESEFTGTFNRATIERLTAEVGGGRGDLRQGRMHRVEQGVLEEQVVRGVAGQPQLGEHRDRDPVLVTGPRLLEHRGRIGGGFGEVDRERARCHACESLCVRRGEVHLSTLER